MTANSNPFPAALPAAAGSVFALDEELLGKGLAASRRSPRGRIIFPIHRRQDAPVQRMLNFLQPGTYVAPHRHPLAGASETLHALRGELGFLVFGEEGSIREVHRLKAGAAAALLDIEPGVWHGMVALAADTVLLEIKRGPYDSAADKEFAPWAPREGEAGAARILDAWQKACG